LNPVFAGLPTTVFEEMSGLARRLGAVNLGQGFPDSQGPDDVRAKAADFILNGHNQYPPMLGLPDLRAAISAHYKRFQTLDLDPDEQVVVTAGATEALAASILALVSPGDEVVLFQPMFDVYLPLVLQAGGTPKFVSLQPPEWALTEDALAAVFSPKTKLVIFNSPQNPAAVVYGIEQLKRLSDFCRRFDVIALCDEVWEHVVFDGRRHTPLYALPGMAERCVKIGSGGKIFSLTGWKVGWACAAPEIAAVIAKAHQFITFTVAPATQAAVAYGLGKDDRYFKELGQNFQRSRDRLAAGLEGAGYAVLPSQGTYFLNIDLAASGIGLDDRSFCLRAVQEAGVAAIPVSAFYAQAPVTHIVRLCLAKKDATLDAGVERLAKAKRLLG
jgi:aspartate/methionine/tyrosine aminotransferase